MKHFDDPRIERNFLSSLGFFTTFGAARGMAYAAKRRAGPFRNMSAGRVRLHHSAFGIVALLGAGYWWLQDIGTGGTGPRWVSRITSLLYGAGSALTLDESNLWLEQRRRHNIRGSGYWQGGAHTSIYAILLFGSSLLLSLGASPWLRRLLKEDADRDGVKGDG